MKILAMSYKFILLLSYKLSQDHLETFFSTVRSRCGYNNNPSAKEFKITYKKFLVHHHVSGSQYGNCLPESMLKNVSSNKLPDSILEIEQTIDEELELSHDNDHINMYKYLLMLKMLHTTLQYYGFSKNKLFNL